MKIKTLVVTTSVTCILLSLYSVQQVQAASVNKTEAIAITSDTVLTDDTVSDDVENKDVVQTEACDNKDVVQTEACDNEDVQIESVASEALPEDTSDVSDEDVTVEPTVSEVVVEEINDVIKESVESEVIVPASDVTQVQSVVEDTTPSADVQTEPIAKQADTSSEQVDVEPESDNEMIAQEKTPLIEESAHEVVTDVEDTLKAKSIVSDYTQTEPIAKQADTSSEQVDVEPESDNEMIAQEKTPLIEESVTKEVTNTDTETEIVTEAVTAVQPRVKIRDMMPFNIMLDDNTVRWYTGLVDQNKYTDNRRVHHDDDQSGLILDQLQRSELFIGVQQEGRHAKVSLFVMLQPDIQSDVLAETFNDIMLKNRITLSVQDMRLNGQPVTRDRVFDHVTPISALNVLHYTFIIPNTTVVDYVGDVVYNQSTLSGTIGLFEQDMPVQVWHVKPVQRTQTLRPLVDSLRRL